MATDSSTLAWKIPWTEEPEPGRRPSKDLSVEHVQILDIQEEKTNLHMIFFGLRFTSIYEPKNKMKYFSMCPAQYDLEKSSWHVLIPKLNAIEENVTRCYEAKTLTEVSFAALNPWSIGSQDMAFELVASALPGKL
ncbi:hypothetical protein MG293_000758 [Ovis ammon polii]|uniref:Uncharacterized protein n=1 Tax=Ovis ammon polii TaxID=230172 RepID=A0AAD4YHL3_OVIAM|nr:hypothetical protein MG293_000758 [Ovis ammon polii]